MLLAQSRGLAVFMQYFMGLFYIVFSFFKFLDYTSFPSSFRQYDPITKRLPFYGWVYPFHRDCPWPRLFVVFQVEIGFGLPYSFWEHNFWCCATASQEKYNPVCMFRHRIKFTHDRGYLGGEHHNAGMALGMLFGLKINLYF